MVDEHEAGLSRRVVKIRSSLCSMRGLLKAGVVVSMKWGVVPSIRPSFLVDRMSWARCSDVRQLVVGGGRGYTTFAGKVMAKTILEYQFNSDWKISNRERA